MSADKGESSADNFESVCSVHGAAAIVVYNTTGGTVAGPLALNQVGSLDSSPCAPSLSPCR